MEPGCDPPRKLWFWVLERVITWGPRTGPPRAPTLDDDTPDPPAEAGSAVGGPRTQELLVWPCFL